MPLDVTYKLQVPHKPGQLQKVAAVIADHKGLIGDIVTIHLGRELTDREITVEVRDPQHGAELAASLSGLEGVRLVWHHDRAFLRHEGGKLRTEAVTPVRTPQEMRDVYTPGVARVCSAIAENPQLAAKFTSIGRTVAICTNGSRVLGLGDIGPVASMPVMEGKAVFYSQFAGISAVPVLVDTKDVDEFVETVVRIAPSFGGIHLEDISAPECFEIERRLIERLGVPVMHDDVHGTAVVSVAAVLTVCRALGRDLGEVTVGQLGLGAAGYGIAALVAEAGAAAVVAFDPNEDSHGRAREAGIEVTTMDDVFARADIVVATTGRPGLITPSMVRPGQAILALTNPIAEIDPDAALAAGAGFAADGRSVNNVIGYPGIFRGALLAGADRITSGMKLAAARAISELTEGDDLVPDALEAAVHTRVAEAVHAAALEEGHARPDQAPSGL
ncbi:NAD-dependent malic enzyme [Conexibacter sp. W3-3-2]|uniref:NAD-dependent malic enzyme n=1 Tax=Conexibacter sp. W3-3-2 TaxID=2675227 RepID=UPI0012B9305E|nr:NAD(P)-dependent oxidoreductase [Conexibacter sp. W3-3-2]MTD45199.1 NAD-dependent malic enzyme [Conexibacter sp. W3-3-2]